MFQVAFDATDPQRLADFWAGALVDRGYRPQPPPPGFDSWQSFLASRGVPEERWGSAAALIGPDERSPRLFFQRVPEPKTAKNRVHLDLGSGGGPTVPLEEQRRRVDAAVDRLTALGATFVERREELGVCWAVMNDPEGNEFCA